MVGGILARMSRNPYERGGVDGADEGAGREGFEGYVGRSRTSLLAVASLVFSLVCCVPPLGVVAIALGAIALALIGRSRGRLTGNGLAITGIIIGIIVTALQAAAGGGVFSAYRYYTQQMIPAAEAMVLAGEAGDVGTLRGGLTTTADADLTDERIAMFFAALRTRAGAPTRAHDDLETLFATFAETYQGSRRRSVAGPGNVQSVEGVVPIPAPFECANGLLLVWVGFAEDSLGGTGGPRIADLLVQMHDREAFTLREAGPGVDVALSMALQVATLEDVISGKAGAPPALPAPPDAPPEEQPGEAPAGGPTSEEPGG